MERIIVVRTHKATAFDAIVDRLQAEGIQAEVNEYPKTTDAYRRLDQAQQKPYYGQKILQNNV